MEQQIKLAAKLYRCRDSMKALFKNEYHQKIESYVSALNEYAEKKDLDIFKAVLEICDVPHIKDNSMACVLYMAAAVEILEPSTPPLSDPSLPPPTP